MKVETLRGRLREAGLEPPAFERWAADGGFDRLAAFFEARAAWAGTHNLSGPRALDDPWGADLADGVATAALAPPDRPLVDVGAGSGVPGLIVACLEPARAVWLVEPIAKRTAFLRSVATRLGLGGVRVVRARWPVPLGEVGDAVEVVSRAVVDPGDWPALAARGGAPVKGIIRLLAARRPAFGVSGFACVDRLDYELPAHGARSAERWVRSA